MAGDWATAAIGEVADKVAMGPFGSSIKVETFVTSGIPVISGQHLHGIKLLDSKFNFITPEHAERLRNSNVQRGDVIFTHAGNIGQVAYVPWDSRYERYVISQRQFYMRCNRERIIPEFVVYYFKTREGQHKLLANASQTGVPSIAQPVSYLRTVDIPVPPLPEQRAIACILGALDDKIELNRRMSQTLEAMARAIFKSWFVDFDPVRAKAEARDPGLPQHIAGLFPDSFADSALGEIPRGWRVDSILTLGALLSGGTPSTKVPGYWNGGIKWVSAKDVSSAHGTFLLNTERTITQDGVENSSARILPELTSVVTARGTVGSYCILAEPMAMNQTNYGLRAKSRNADYFVFFALGHLVSQLKQRAYGTIFDTVTTRTFETSEIVVPGDAVIAQFDQHVQPQMEKIRQDLRLSSTLAVLRDALLPKLISGELRVPDAERLVGRCV